VDDNSTVNIVVAAEDATTLTVSQTSGVDVDLQGLSSSSSSTADLAVTVEDDDGNNTISGLAGPFTIPVALPDVEETSIVELNLVVSNGTTSVTETVTLSIADVTQPTSTFFQNRGGDGFNFCGNIIWDWYF